MNSCITWDFRSNEKYHTKNEIINFLTKNCKMWCFQLEKGETSDYIHWQGRFKLIKKLNKIALLKLFEKNNFKEPNYCEPTTNTEHINKSMFYVLKEQTRIKGPFTDINYLNEENNEDESDEIYFNKFLDDPNIFIPYTLKNINWNTLYPFQKKILQSSKIINRNSRIINLIIDKIGNRGKSTISTYIRIGKFGLEMPSINDYDKIISSCCDMLISKNLRDPKLILFDLPRAMTKNKLHGFMCAFEQIKKGYVYDHRNKWQEWDFHPPQIWVFCNEELDLSLLSNDRWKLWKINNNNDLEEYTS